MLEFKKPLFIYNLIKISYISSICVRIIHLVHCNLQDTEEIRLKYPVLPEANFTM